MTRDPFTLAIERARERREAALTSAGWALIGIGLTERRYRGSAFPMAANTIAEFIIPHAERVLDAHNELHATMKASITWRFRHAVVGEEVPF